MTPRRFALILIGCALLIAAQLAHNIARADTRLTMGGGIYHTIADRDEVNEANYFMAASHGAAYVGTFVNSQWTRSFTGGVVFRASGDVWEGSMYIGAVSGYRDGIDGLPCTGDGVCLYLSPAIQWWIADNVGLTALLFGESIVYAASIRVGE